jgi:hypothetical protein
MKSAVLNLFTLSLGGKNQLVTFRFLSASKNLSTRSSQVPFYPKALGGKNQLVTFRFLSASKNLSTRSSQVPFYSTLPGGSKVPFYEKFIIYFPNFFQ